MIDKPKAACVIGWPVEHSRSPLIHNYWIRQLGISAEYRREAVPPDRFADFAAHLAEHGYLGASVTVPHKQAALALSQPDQRARAVGAANTLWLEAGALRSTNTDIEGFVANLDAAAPGWEQGLQQVALLGAGGAARAIVFGLLERGVPRIHVFNRSFEHASELCGRFGDKLVAHRWDEAASILPSAGMLVNTTSLGMVGQPPLTLDIAALPGRAIVADIVYAPLETPLLIAARERGLRSIDGLGMLLHQAVGGFERWFGTRPRVTAELRALVEADLQAK